jgi:hypothetical protein
MEQRSPIWRVAGNILNKKSRTADRGGSPASGLVEFLKTPHYKTGLVKERINMSRSSTNTLVRPLQWKTDMIFSTRNVRSLYSSGSLITVARELAR